MAPKYRTTVDYGYDANGKRLRKQLYASTKAELKKKEVAFRASVLSGTVIVNEHTTFGEYAQIWLKSAKAFRSENTKDTYGNCLRNHLSVFDAVPISKIKPSMIQKAINDKADHPKICNFMMLTLRQIFKMAMRDGLIAKNPCEGVEKPAYKAKEKRALTPYEKKRIFLADLKDQDRLFLYIAYGCGLRREEILALTRHDIDLKKNVIHVTKAVAIKINGGQPILKETKSAAGVRDVPMPTFLSNYIKEYLTGHRDIILFTSKNGNYYCSTVYQRMWKRIKNAIYTDLTPAQKLEEPQDLTAHILRHNYCTELCYAGVSVKEVTRLMGHSDYHMIMEVYSHIDAEKEKTVEKIAAINF